MSNTAVVALPPNLTPNFVGFDVATTNSTCYCYAYDLLVQIQFETTYR